MCSNVFMGGTKHITMRMPEELVDAIDRRAERDQRSRSQVAVLVLEREFGDGKVKGQSDQVREVPVAVQPEEHKPQTASRREVVSVKPAAASRSCPSCGGMNGMHQRGCKA